MQSSVGHSVRWGFFITLAKVIKMSAKKYALTKKEEYGYKSEKKNK